MNIIDGLNGLSQPQIEKMKINISTFKRDDLLKYLIKMLTIRAAERKLAFGKKMNLIGGPVHLGVGQEAAAVGVAALLRPTDRVFGTHRSHAHLLSMDMNLRALFAETLGRKTGFSKGMGGSMHLWSQSTGFYGSVPIVSGTVPLAVGAGLAAKFQRSGDVSVAFFGDGAMEEGIVHESLNFARIKRIPVLFVVENNLFASHMHISERQPNTSTARFAKANEIPSKVVDGNDIAKVVRAANKLVSSARLGDGPGFLELVTHRWYGHVDWREDIDVGVNRSKKDLENWKLLDPIARLKAAMIEKEWLMENEFEQAVQSVNEKVEQAWKIALTDPFPDKQMLHEFVYQGGQ